MSKPASFPNKDCSATNQPRRRSESRHDHSNKGSTKGLRPHHSTVSTHEISHARIATNLGPADNRPTGHRHRSPQTEEMHSSTVSGAGSPAVDPWLGRDRRRRGEPGADPSTERATSQDVDDPRCPTTGQAGTAISILRDVGGTTARLPLPTPDGAAQGAASRDLRATTTGKPPVRRPVEALIPSVHRPVKS
jgi:hypothetical protein